MTDFDDAITRDPDYNRKAWDNMSNTETAEQTEFIDQYIETALWADGEPIAETQEEFDNIEFGGLEHLTIRPEARAELAKDCLDFIEHNRADIEYVVNADVMGDYDWGSAGHDFWLTRNGHGAGFWDRYYGKDMELHTAFTRLSEAAKVYGTEDELRPFDCGDGTADVNHR